MPTLVAALDELSDEEPYIDARWENGQKEIMVSTTGRIQLEVLSNLLKERYNLSAEFSLPTVIYKETPSSAGTGLARYTMPKPCWAVIEFYIELMPRSYGVSYHGDCRTISAINAISHTSEHPLTSVCHKDFMVGR